MILFDTTPWAVPGSSPVLILIFAVLMAIDFLSFFTVEEPEVVMPLSIRVAQLPEDVDTLLALGERIYADDPAWVEPLRMIERRQLDPDKNAFFRHAELILFLITGESKARIVAEAFGGKPHDVVHPCELVVPVDGRREVLLDQAAAKLL